MPFDLRVPELRLGLPLELRLRDLHRDDRGEPLADVVPAEALLQVLGQVVLGGVEIDRARERRAETREVRPALVGVDVVGERVEGLRIAVVPLQGDLGFDAVLLAAHVDRLVVDHRLVRVEVLHERVDAALVLELVVLPLALVLERDRHPGVEEGQFAQPLGQRVVAEIERLEDRRVRKEGDLGAAPLRLAGHLERGDGPAALVGLLVDLVVAPDLELEPLGERVDDRDADAVQTARDLVALVVELAAGVQHRQHDLGGRLPRLVHVHGNAATVVDDGHRVVDVNGDRDLAAVAGQRLVDRVVHHLPDEVVEADRPRGADVHRRALADRFQTLEDLDLVGPVGVHRRVDRRPGILTVLSRFHYDSRRHPHRGHTRIGINTYV